MDIIIIEGIDCSGKSSVIQELKKLYGSYRLHPLFFDRFIYSNYVYESLRGNIDSYIHELLETFKKFNETFNLKIFYIDVDAKVAFERMKNKNDFFKYSCDEYNEMKKLFIKSFDIFCGDITIVNGNKSLDEVVSTIWKKLT